MNILFVHSNGIVPTAGGISRTTANLARLFRQRGHNIWFLSATDRQPGVEYDNNQHFLPSASVADSKNEEFVTKLIVDNGICFVINQSPFSFPIVSLLHRCSGKSGVKVISCYHNSILTPVIRYAYCHEYQLKQRRLGLLFHLLRWKPVADIIVRVYIAKWRQKFRETVDMSDVVVMLCDGQVEELLRMCGYDHCEKARVIPNCIPAVENTDKKKRQIVVWTGTFDYAIKRPDYMLRIWQKISPRHPDWKLYMLGDGPSLSAMKKMAEQNRIKNVVFTGRVVPDEYYSKSQIQCVTSVHEAFPMITVEAMSHQAPVIAFNSFTSAEYIIKDHYSGILIEPFEINKYADQLDHLMNDTITCLNMGDNAKKSLSRFSEEEIYCLWNELFGFLYSIN